MFKANNKALLIIISFAAIYISLSVSSYGQCKQKMFFKLEKLAKTEGKKYIRNFEISPKSVVNTSKKLYKLKLNKGTTYTFYMYAKQSELYAKLALYDSELNVIDSVINQEKQKYYSMDYVCPKSEMCFFEISGIKKKVSKKTYCIPAILTFTDTEE